MVLNGIHWLWNRLRPPEGWLAFFLLGSAILCLVLAVKEVGWVPEDGVVIPTAMLGLLLAVVLAKRPLQESFAWLFLILYGVMITTIDLARLWPSFAILLNDDLTITQIWRQNSALFYDRMASWFKAVFSGGSSQETIVFAFGLGLLAWFLATYAGWSTFRRHKPLQGLTLIGVALTLNGYYGDAQIYWIAAFVGLAAIITAVLHYAHLEQGWESNRVDYSDEVRLELIFYAIVIAVLLLTVAVTLPAINFKEMAHRFQSQPVIQQAEETLGKAFAGVRQPQRGTAVSPGGVGGRGIMPRSYLIGNAPELSERVMMTAGVNIINADGIEQPATALLLQGIHWRGLSYDVYTGRGWALSEERQEPTTANQAIPIPPIAQPLRISQSVNWEYDQRVIRYTLGLPLQFDQNVTVNWRGLEDLSRVQGEGLTYNALSQMTTASAEDLRTAQVQNIPPAILARYTELPPSVPQRVHDLAAEIGGHFENPYDQARALEQFLRQYPYSLDVDLPPDNVDPVDYFLFDLQIGYCDYYASSMVVLARSLGLPARVTVGYLSQPADETGKQTVYQINAHSWAEIYFAGYGWIEFEPTAPFTSPRDTLPLALDPGNLSVEFISPDDASQPPPLPDRDNASRFPWGRLVFLLLLFAVIGFYGWWQRKPEQQGAEAVLWAYGRLQQQAHYLGHETTPNQTPHEFMVGFLNRLHLFQQHSRLKYLVKLISLPIRQLTTLYEQQRYAEMKPDEGTKAKRLWGEIRRPFWWLRLSQRFMSLRNHANKKGPAG